MTKSKKSLHPWMISTIIFAGLFVLIAIIVVTFRQIDFFGNDDFSNLSNDEYVKKSVEVYKSKITLPVKADDITTIIDIRAEGNSIVYDALISGADPEQVDIVEQKNDILDKLCTTDDSRDAFKRGITMTYNYKFKDRTETLYIIVSEEDCLHR